MTKKEKIKIKKYKAENKKLIKKYPWLKHINYNNKHSLVFLDYIPKGWSKAFGRLLLEDLDREIKKSKLVDKFKILEIKEKFGELRIYTFGENEEIARIIDDYSVLSRNICLICGKPDVPMTHDGWYFPCCEKCWDKLGYKNDLYKKYLGEDCNMSNHYTVRRFSVGGYVDKTIDISDKAKKIRDNYKYRG